MPEGDTIHKVALALQPHLEGAQLTFLTGRGWGFRPQLEGVRVERIRAEGKHLWIDFAGCLSLRTHLGMGGTWHRYGFGERWRRHAAYASAWLRTDTCDVVCFDAAEVEIGPRLHLAPSLAGRVGPDLMHEAPDFDRIVAGVRALQGEHTTVGEVLLDQRIAAGIGNVFKCELLFKHALSPYAPPSLLGPKRWHALYRDAGSMLRANLPRGRRVTVAPGARHGLARLWVYGREHRPCLRCQTPVARTYVGAQNRPSYFCRRCQYRGDPQASPFSSHTETYRDVQSG